ncbi:MAG: dephospho-CoA kinase [Chthoniobacterales bacterium]
MRHGRDGHDNHNDDAAPKHGCAAGSVNAGQVDGVWRVLGRLGKLDRDLAQHRTRKARVAVIGITGGVATGKSAFLGCLRELRAGTFFDADRAVHLLHGDSEVRGLVTREFGAQAYSASGDLNRAWIRGIVFADAEKKRALEQILHPRIRRQWAAEAERWRNSHDLFFADIPLLYETAGETLCDRVVVVACSAELQRERLMKRMSISHQEAERMIAAQMPLAEKMHRADHVVWNNASVPELCRQGELLVRRWKLS